MTSTLSTSNASVSAKKRKPPKTGPTRDQQRQRIYDAEHAVESHFALMPLENVKLFVSYVLDSSLWRERWPQITTVDVGDGRRRRRAAAFCDLQKISMPRAHRSKLGVLHELAHLATDAQYGHQKVAYHSPQFARIFLDLVTRFCTPAQAQAFRKALTEKSVKLHRVSAQEREVADLRAEIRCLEADIREKRTRLMALLNTKRATL